MVASAADGPGLDTDALFTCPLPLHAPVELPFVNSVVKLRHGENKRKIISFLVQFFNVSMIKSQLNLKVIFSYIKSTEKRTKSNTFENPLYPTFRI